MILKQLRLSKHLSQEQLALMSGLNVRTIQRIESGHNASLESLKCLAAALEVDIDTLKREKFMVDRQSENWKQLPLLVKAWFAFNFLQLRPRRATAARVGVFSHVAGFIFCCWGFVSEPALAGGIILLANAYLFHLLKWQGDRYGLWFDEPPAEPIS